MHAIKMKTIILSALILCFCNAVAYSLNEEDEQRPIETKIHKPVIISTSKYDIDRDGKRSSRNNFKEREEDT